MSNKRWPSLPLLLLAALLVAAVVASCGAPPAGPPATEPPAAEVDVLHRKVRADRKYLIVLGSEQRRVVSRAEEHLLTGVRAGSLDH